MSDSAISPGRNVSKHLVSPIVLLIPIILITAFSGKGFDFSGISPIFAIGVAFIYLIASGFFIILCQRGKTKAAIAVALATDGMVVIFCSSAFDAPMAFNFIGFLAVIAGIVTGISVATPSGESMFARKIDRIVPTNVGIEELRRIIDSIQFPCVFMERDGNGGEKIVAYNQPFVDDFKLNRARIMGSSLDALLPIEPGKSRVNYEGEAWTVKRTVKGRQVLMMLSPVIKEREASKIEVFDAIDPSTGLYVVGFMKYKAKADIESANRGKRRLSAALFKLSFPPGSTLGVTEEEQKLAAVIFGRIVQQSIRVCDSAYRTSDDEVLLIMPDTPNSGSKIVVSRIYDALKRTSAVECPCLSKALLDNVEKDYLGGTDLPEHDKILAELSVLLYRSNPDLAANVG
jgi:GGDEF domain-containing protein